MPFTTLSPYCAIGGLAQILPGEGVLAGRIVAASALNLTEVGNPGMPVNRGRTRYDELLRRRIHRSVAGTQHCLLFFRRRASGNREHQTKQHQLFHFVRLRHQELWE